MKKFYVTTAIPYVNAKPHIGNALDYLLGDIVARYEKSLGKEVRFQVGTDEHGNKIAAKAEENGLEPKAYVDQMYGNFQILMKAVGASYTDFVRTSDYTHEKSAQYIWTKLKPYIYKGTYEGWYCVGCEAFVTDKEATTNNGICPIHGQPYQRLSEENYYFKLSAFTEQIKTAITTGKFRIEPEFRQKEILGLLESGLEDISISRPKKHLSWGIPVPDDPEHVMYVWIDALSNYITVLGYPEDESWHDSWPADVQIIGKDIIRFHAAIWPAMLIGLDLPLPKKLLVHGFVNVGGTKMSKSIGNVVDPMEIIETYGADAFRYYFARHIPTMDDGDFTWEKFENAYNNELGNELGNLVQRVTSMINRYQEGVVSEGHVREHDTQLYRDAMQALHFDRALDITWSSIRSLNVYLEDVKPWQIAKKKDEDPEAAAHLNEVLSYCASTLVQIADTLAPFTPTTSAAIKKIFDGGVISPFKGVLFPKIYQHTPDPRAPKTADTTPEPAPKPATPTE
ncbi:MAG TPA: methionine--tRNA ligase [Candidatus Saccharimonadales bacterium]|jgi:methionyl-tRNA synthetase|nr:methionine--tRNA ligase [Candidatus Saccharimonadales bacterium]